MVTKSRNKQIISISNCKIRIMLVFLSELVYYYSIMGCSPAASSAATTGGYYHPLTAPCVAVILVIRLATWWWKPYRTFIINPITTQLSLQYIITDLSTALYITPRSRTITPVFANTLNITPHRLYTFFRF